MLAHGDLVATPAVQGPCTLLLPVTTVGSFRVRLIASESESLQTMSDFAIPDQTQNRQGPIIRRRAVRAPRSLLAFGRMEGITPPQIRTKP